MNAIGPSAAYFEPPSRSQDEADLIDEEYARLMAGECNPTSEHMIADAIGNMDTPQFKELAEALQVGNLLGAGAALDSIVRNNAQARARAAAERVLR
jgi:hypothetical protein